jgi:VWFA-related protein
MLRQFALICLSILCVASVGLSQDWDEIVLWPEHQRSFLQDVPALLLTEEQRQTYLDASSEERESMIEAFLANDPVPETPENELLEAIEARYRLVHSEFLALEDQRAAALFLHGRPTQLLQIECAQTFKPIEIWVYGDPETAVRLVFYEAVPNGPYRVWLPVDSKRVLYNAEMEYWLEQWEELGGRKIAKRFDLQICKDARLVDEATGVEGLRGFLPNRPQKGSILQYFAPPADLADWARQAVANDATEVVELLETTELKVFFPDKVRQRTVARFVVAIPSSAELEIAEEDEEQGLILLMEGVIEQKGRVFDEFRVRFKIEPPTEDVPIALAMDQALRPHRTFLVRLRVKDEVGGAEAYVTKGFVVPDEPQPMDIPPVPEGTIVAMGQDLANTQIQGADSLLLVPPPTEVVLGLWRAEALVTGGRIAKVRFLVDGKPQMTRSTRPFAAELRLAKFPVEQVVRAEGIDITGEVVDSDEVVINQPRGALRVRIIDPVRGAPVSGRILARAEVVVPEERRVEKVEFKVNEELVAELQNPPWEVEIDVPPAGGMAYLTVAAVLDDESSAEEVRFLNAPQFLEEVEVKLVELFTTVTDKSGRPVKGLTQEDFVVKEDGRPQKITKFELVEDLPLNLGIVIDTSTSMTESLPEAKQAAIGFLENMITLRDKVFAVGFSDQPRLLIAPTDDVTAVQDSLEDLKSLGWTTLHDAIVTSLYYFRAVRGRRALILLSDGDDTASAMPFRDSLEYARRSGVTVFSIGLDVGALERGVRNKLTHLAEETGGRVFFISRAQELAGVYREIEEELRSQYLIAYASDNPDPEGEFREVEVDVKSGKLKARTMRGYYP